MIKGLSTVISEERSISEENSIPDRKLSELRRFVYTFTSPRRTFLDVKKRPKWLMPWLVLSLSSLASGLMIAEKVDLAEYFRGQIRNGFEMFEELTPSQQQRNVEIAVRIFKFN